MEAILLEIVAALYFLRSIYATYLFRFSFVTSSTAGEPAVISR